ncbi:hypothetical protein BIFBRE_04907 [Bifidobacterium breve DSM 20213 = JCM 1192]|uniref:Uncharacterized protein n=1 Tax=Bifidobacterium breve DSM 20213 = JCM 1192 TaxID=518634 RepID=D4BS16_BIFBR|nr:hypothetical protein BIFBRE_04907 [Bifidobacterium breve DSM 20213 = JCM 1192]
MRDIYEKARLIAQTGLLRLYQTRRIRRLDACRGWRPSYDDPCAYVRACP